MKKLLLFTFLLLSISTLAQTGSTGLGKEFHQSRRADLREQLPAQSVAVIFSAFEKTRSNDVLYQFHQDPDYYYLTGLNEPNSLLIIFKEKQKLGGYYSDEFLFIPEKDPKKEIWTGKRLGKEKTTALTGIEAVFSNTTLNSFKIDFSLSSQLLLKDLPTEDCDETEYNELVKYLRLKIRFQNPNVNTKKLSEILAKMREIKSKEEIAQVQKAIDITCKAQSEVMRALEPGSYEYQTQAILEYTFKNNGSDYPAFPSIVGGGENSCILHYVTNNKKLEGKDMLVVDIGAEYNGYAADVTRTIPVDGKFSEEEKAIYNLVLEAQAEGIKACKAGNNFYDPDKAAREVIKKGLLQLGIIKEENDHKKYFMHGTSHYLGLDVHDAGTYKILKPNNIITVEPGIYIPENSSCDPKWWNIGVRIEDDVLITEKEPIVMSAAAPKTIEEIEKTMKEESLFNQIKEK